MHVFISVNKLVESGVEQFSFLPSKLAMKFNQNDLDRLSFAKDFEQRKNPTKLLISCHLRVIDL